MKHISFLLPVFLLSGVLSLYAQKTILDPNAQVRNVGSFNAINVGGAFDVLLTQASEHAVVVSASDIATRDLIETEVRSGTLFIRLKKNNFDWKGNKKLRAYISAPALQKIEVSGSCDLKLENVLKGDDLELKISGSSDVEGRLEVKNMRLNSSGSSDFKLAGSAENLKVSLSGSSDLKAYDLAVDYCDISCSGSSDVQITANKEMKVNVSGASNVSYKGTAQIKEIKTSGSSSLKKRD